MDLAEEVHMGRLSVPRFATLRELVYQLTDELCSTNQTLLDVVLTCLTTFSSEMELFQLLKERYERSDGQGSDHRTPGAQIQIRVKVMLVLRSWMRKLVESPVPLDEAYENKTVLAKGVMSFVSAVAIDSGPAASIAKSILSMTEIFELRVQNAKTMWEAYESDMKGRSLSTTSEGVGRTTSQPQGRCPSPALLGGVAVALASDLDSDSECGMEPAFRDVPSPAFSEEGPGFGHAVVRMGTPPSPITTMRWANEGMTSINVTPGTSPAPFSLLSESPVSLSPSLTPMSLDRMAALAFDDSPSGPYHGTRGVTRSVWRQAMGSPGPSTPVHVSSTSTSSAAFRFLRVPKEILSLPITELFSPMGLADALTALDWGLWTAALRPSELLSLAWTQPHLKTLHPDVGGGLGAQRLIQSTNHLVAWCAEQIVEAAATRGFSEAAVYLHYFIATARQAFKINNFNALFVLVSSLSLPAVKHLKPAWGDLQPSVRKLFAALKSLCDSSSNYAAYRKVLAQAQTQKEPHIPVFQVAVRDITYVHSAGPWTVASAGPGRGDVDRVDLRKVKSVCDSLELLLLRRERRALERVVPGVMEASTSADTPRCPAQASVGANTSGKNSSLPAVSPPPPPPSIAGTSTGRSAGTSTSGSSYSSSSVTGLSYTVAVELSDETLVAEGSVSPSQQLAALLSPLAAMGKVLDDTRFAFSRSTEGGKTANGNREGGGSDDDERIGTEKASAPSRFDVVPSFLSLHDQCTRSLFARPLLSTTRSRSSSAAMPMPRQRLDFDEHGYGSPRASADGSRASPLCTPGEGGGGMSAGMDAAGLATPVGSRPKSAGSASANRSSSSTTRSEPKKGWKEDARFSIRCSEVQLSYLLTAIVTTPVDFTSLMTKAKRAKTEDERKQREARTQGSRVVQAGER